VEDGEEQSDGGDGRSTLIQPLTSKGGKEDMWKKDICMMSLLTNDDVVNEDVGDEDTSLNVPVPEEESVEIADTEVETVDKEVDHAVEKVVDIVIMNAGPSLSFGGRQLYLACIALNLSLCLVRASSTSPQLFWFLIVFINVVGLTLLDQDGGCNQSRHVATTMTNGKQLDKNARQTLTSSKKEVKKNRAINESTSDLKMIPTNGFKPTAGSSSIQVDDPEKVPMVNGRNFLAWKPISNSMIQVRSHGYLTSRKKISTPEPLYRLVAVDALSSEMRIPQIASLVKLPGVSFDDDELKKTWHSPDVFVISIAIPTDVPTFGKPTDNGFGFTITGYYVMTPETRKILRRVTSPGYDPSTDNSEANKDVQSRLTNSVRLWEEWCRKAPTDSDVQARFKFIPNIHNAKEIGLPSYMNRYCGKPVLIKRKGVTGFLSCYPKLNTMEFTVSIHAFPYLAKKATAYMKDNIFHKVLFSLSYVIEGRSDDELPEAVIGNGFMMCYPNPNRAIRAEDFFGGTAVSSVEDNGKIKNEDEVIIEGVCP